MRNAVLYTKSPLLMEECLEQIKTVYKGAIGNDSQIYLGKAPKSLYIWLPSTNLNDPIDSVDMADDLDNIPFENPYFTHIDFHLLTTLQNVVKSIFTLYPEMIVWTDDDVFYTCSDFINMKFDY